MRQYIDANDKRNEIRLLFRHPSYKDKIIIVVEGNSDIKLFRKLIQDDRIKIESIDGKKDLIKVMKELSVEYPDKILGICDADFDHLIGIAEERRKYSVYVTDNHDIEIMMLLSPAIHSFYHEYSVSHNIETLREKTFELTLEASYVIGTLRWINIEHNLNLNFKSLNYNEFVNVNRLEIVVNESLLIKNLIDRSPCLVHSVNEKFLFDLIREYEKKSGCRHQVCCGHDITNIIALVYRQSWASVDTNMNFKKIEIALRIGYQLSYFYGTRLYQNLEKKLSSFNIQLSSAKEAASDFIFAEA